MYIATKGVFNRIANILFPRLCSCCGENSDAGIDICSACQWHLPWVEEACRRCGLPTQTHDDWRDCVRCREQPPLFDRLCTLFYYQPPIKKMITQLKFSRRLSVAHGLGTLFANRLAHNGYTPSTLPELVLPMPLHRNRLRQRGYNQAYELSRGLAPYLKINDRLCWRIKSTAAQSSLGKSARRKNISNAFAVSPDISAYKHVAIFDDVVTTGATVNALAGVLKDSGVEQVDIWCICRA